jgi:hypothetical protein
MHIEFLVEELSAEMTLHNLLPKLVTGDHTYRIISFQGKQDLLKKLPIELRGYRRWINDEFKIVVLIDKDQQECHKLKGLLENISEVAGLITRSKATGKSNFHVLNRIAIEELESWFFGDPDAVKMAYPKVSSKFNQKAQYRIPDQIQGGTWEAMERILQAGGYFKSGYRKTEAAQRISQYMEPLRNRSKSFQVFWNGISFLLSSN